MTPDFTIELCIYVYVGIGTTTQITCVSMNEYQEGHILTYTYICEQSLGLRSNPLVINADVIIPNSDTIKQIISQQ